MSNGLVTFEAWKRAVDAEIQRRCGMSADDLPDWRYRDDFADKVTPARCAARAIKNAKE